MVLAEGKLPRRRRDGWDVFRGKRPVMFTSHYPEHMFMALTDHFQLHVFRCSFKWGRKYHIFVKCTQLLLRGKVGVVTLKMKSYLYL